MEKKLTYLILQQFQSDEYLLTQKFNKALNSSKADLLRNLPSTEHKYIRHFYHPVT